MDRRSEDVVRKKIALLSQEFEASRKLLVALGDESRQHLVLSMMDMADCSGVRAVDIAERSRLSRPAVSHHLQILKDAGLVKSRKEGTKVFYYFDPDMESMTNLVNALQLAMEITRELHEEGNAK